MRLSKDDALARLAGADHGIFCTVHAERGVDAVPVVFAVDGARWLGVPVDRVKPKDGARLQRERNLEVDERATLLVEHWDHRDWAKLWWVRVELRWRRDAPVEQESLLGRLLADRYPQYQGQQPFHRVLVLRIGDVVGWSASIAPD